LIRILSLNMPISLTDSVSIGTSLATGFPCLVMTMPSGSTLSSSARHWALKRAAGMVYKICPYDHLGTAVPAIPWLMSLAVKKTTSSSGVANAECTTLDGM